MGIFIMKEIQLTQGKVALVDDEDYEYLNQFKWYAHKDYKSPNIWYAVRSEYTKGKLTMISMHWVIMNKKLIDHVDTDGLNNQKYNLRHCTRQQNSQNKNVYKNSTSTFKGVCWNIIKQKWQTSIGYNSKRIFLGYYISKIEAAKEYDIKAKELFGEFANLNFKERIIRKRRIL